MTKNKFKIIVILFIYLSFIFLIFIAFNAVNQAEKLVIIEEKRELVEKVENNFTRNKNSVYEILESKENKSSLKKNQDLNKDNSLMSPVLKSSGGNYYIQFASFKDKKKSDKILDELTKKFQKLSVNVSLEVKKVNINHDQTFFRVTSKSNLTYPNAVSLNKSLKNLKIDCIIVKIQP